MTKKLDKQSQKVRLLAAHGGGSGASWKSGLTVSFSTYNGALWLENTCAGNRVPASNETPTASNFNVEVCFLHGPDKKQFNGCILLEECIIGEGK